MAYYKCPVCGEKLSLNGNSYVCPSRHTFDVAKEGYVNFLTAKDKHAKSPGDNKEMILSRRAIMDEGYYRPISDYVTSEYSLDGTTVLDVGCGEGYLTREISKYCSCYGIDISKEAIRLCAKADKKIFYSVASMTRLPFFDNEFDFVFSLFAPYHAEEIARVLKGKFIVCTPDKRHLFELKEMLYDTPVENSEQDYTLKGFKTERQDKVRGTFVANKQNVLPLLKMTPYYYRTPQSAIEKLSELGDGFRKEISLEFVITTYSKE